jgi:hypothetical protein
MVRQIVLIRWTAEATQEQKQKVMDGLRGLAEVVPGVRAVRMGHDLGVRADNFDFAVSVDFDSPEAYLVYREHPEHLRVVAEAIQPVMAERAGVVFEAV